MCERFSTLRLLLAGNRAANISKCQSWTVVFSNSQISPAFCIFTALSSSPPACWLSVLTGFDRHIRGHRLKTSKKAKKVVWRNTTLTQILQKLHLSSHRFVTQSGQEYHKRWRWHRTTHCFHFLHCLYFSH